MVYETLILEREDGIATITLNRPQRMNALNEQLIAELVQVTDEVGRDDAVKAVVLTGAGRAFCAGGDVHDLPLFYMTDAAEIRGFLKKLNRIPLNLRNMAKPAIAAVNGAAVGAGCSFVMACDIIIASEDAIFGQAFVNVGYHPDSGSSYFLPRLVGVAKACELILTGKAIDAREAEKIGLVNQIVPSETLMATVRELALKIANGPSVAIGLAKRCIYQGLQMNLEQALDCELEGATASILTEDETEGVDAFKEKRKPVFRGR